VILGVAFLVALAAGAVATRDYWSPERAVAQAPSKGKGKKGGPQGAVPVVLAKAEKKKLPVRIELLGTVTPIASVAIKSRLETEIVGVHFSDGAMVKQGDLLFTLDGRALQAQIKEVEGVLASATAQLEQAERDVERYTELAAKNATTKVTLHNAQTQVNVWRAAVRSNSAKLEHLKVQLSYCTIRAPINGRVSMAAVKAGNFVRPADPAPLATIIQTAPVYVTFTLPQRSLPDLREALAAESASIRALVPGDTRHAEGQVTMIENTIDAATGTVAVRATMPNADELLWPGTLVTVQLTFREEEAITVPRNAVQVSQAGSYVFVVKDGIATVRQVKVARIMESETVVESGLSEGEVVVTDGHLRLTNGARVVARGAKTGS
jgi:RND family efflux transporter MFP subunit